MTYGDEVSRPPTPVRRSFALWIAAVVVGLVGSVVAVLGTPAPGAAGGVAGTVVGLLFLGLLVSCALAMRAGRNWARVTLTIVGGVSVLLTVLGLLLSAGLGVAVDAVSTTASLLQAGLTVAAVLLAFRAPANAYFR